METIFSGLSQDMYPRKRAFLVCAEAAIAKRLIANQIEQEMYRSNLSKKALANRMRTSRAALDRLLDPRNTSVTLSTLEKVALALNKRLKVELT